MEGLAYCDLFRQKLSKFLLPFKIAPVLMVDNYTGKTENVSSTVYRSVITNRNLDFFEYWLIDYIFIRFRFLAGVTYLKCLVTRTS